MPTAGHARITPRERQIIRLLLADLKIIQAAAELGMRPATAKVHMRNLHHKTKTTTVDGLIVWCLSHTECCLAPEVAD